MKSALLLLLLAALPLSAEEAASSAPKETASAAAPLPALPPALVYFENGTDTKGMVEQLAPFRKANPQRELKFIPITSQCRTMHDAVNAAKGVVAGITELPCLVLCDEAGEYATLPLRTLTEEALAAAENAATAPDREEKAAARRYLGKEYLLFARMALVQPMDDATLGLCLDSCRALMAYPLATTEDKQLLGLRCLYPLLLEEYKRGYAQSGAHTPATEAKLLEAIAALEAARDIAPDTKLGKQAAAERERLRAARRQARTAE